MQKKFKPALVLHICTTLLTSSNVGCDGFLFEKYFDISLSEPPPITKRMPDRIRHTLCRISF